MSSIQKIILKKPRFIVINNNKVICSGKIGSYHEETLVNQSMENYVYSLFMIDGLEISSYQLDDNSSVVVFGTLQHTDEESDLLCILMRRIGLTPSNKSISSFVGIPFNPNTERTKKINKEAYPIPNRSKEVTTQQIILEKQESHKKPKLSWMKVAIASLIITVGIAGASQYEEVQVWICQSSIKTAYANLDFETAKNCVDLILDEHPNDTQAKYWENIINDALDNWPDNTKRPIGNSKEITNIADDIFLNERNYRKALVLYHVVYVRDNHDSRALNGIGNSLLSINDLDLETIYQKDDFNLKNISKFDVAQKYHEQVISIYNNTGPDNGVPLALNGLGSIYNEKREYDDAIIFFEKAEIESKEEAKKQEKDLTDSSPFKNSKKGLGSVYLRTEKYENAYEMYDTVLKMNENDVDAIAGLGFVYFGQNDTQKAIEQFDKAIKKDQRVIESIIQEGHILVLNEREQEAISLYQLILQKIDLDNIIVMRELGKLFLDLEQFNEAKVHYEKSRQKYPDDLYLKVGHIIVLTKNQEIQTAKNMYESIPSIYLEEVDNIIQDQTILEQLKIKNK